MNYPKCSKCKGLVVPDIMYDNSFRTITAHKCLNCGFVTYPDHTPIPLSYDPIQGGRKGIPMMFRRKEGR